MVHAAKVMASTAVDMLTDPDLLSRAQAEFDEITARTPFRCPIPDDVVAPPLRDRG